MIGTTIRQYRIIEKLGAGGMGVVYRADDLSLRRSVALKFLPPEIVADEERRARFQREARLAAALNHPNICTVYEVGKVEATDRSAATDDSIVEVGTPFIAMEFVDGEMLATRLARTGRLSVHDVLDVAVQVAAGLAEAHANRIVHRDLKPQNVMITAGGRVKVLDFGLAKPVSAVRGADSMISTGEMISADLGEGSVVGTVAYMSPEQALGKSIDARSDVFAFGIMLYELITGEQPFLAGTVTATLARILEAEPPPLAVDEVPPELTRIVHRCLQKKPDDRYAKTDDLVKDLEIVRRHLQTQSTLILGARRAGSQSGHTGRFVTRRNLLVVTLVVVVGSLWYVIGRRSDGRSPATSAARVDAAADSTSPTPATVSPPAQAAPGRPPTPPPQPEGQTSGKTSPSVGTAPRNVPVQASPPVSAPARAPVALTATLTLTSNPRASLVLDGDLVGVSPVSIETKPGIHDIVMTSADGLRWRGRVEVAAGETKTFHRELTARGGVTITAETWVEVSLDGGAAEQTPIHFPRVSAGLHELRAFRDGYTPQVLELAVEEGRTTHVQLRLDKKP